jgi:hypothetical protein
MLEISMARNHGNWNISGGSNDEHSRVPLQELAAFARRLVPPIPQASIQAFQTDEPFVSFVTSDFAPSVLVRPLVSSGRYAPIQCPRSTLQSVIFRTVKGNAEFLPSLLITYDKQDSHNLLSYIVMTALS